MATESLRVAHIRTDDEIALIANRMRHDIIEMIAASGTGHPGGSLSAADIMATLFFSGVMGYDPADPRNPDRDRFILSKGHAAPVLYAVLAQAGYLPKKELVSLRKLGSRLQGHPDAHCCPGVEVCTGSLGQGLSISSGVALGMRLDAARDGSAPQRMFVLLGDGELQEGENWEAAMFAAHRRLDNLVAIVDSNNLQIDGHVCDVCAVEPIDEKFRAFGWHVISCDGHDIAAVRVALNDAVDHEGAPVAIVCRTVKGKGVSFMEDQASWHGSAPSAEQAARALAEIDAAGEQLACAAKEA
ncbi:transketolase subunit A [Coriobacterium glomerans PW2]|uniref:Transketolase subunit A n=1 Tax=Coriobacterium glomerans (strain ATCC 49209 / DSM 20642 / JCM 10262 / PW2) TaxID=700015 RepID=F2NBM0_CORGP|nr:transketolase [Coriobacterium glomerans]AEB06756.1 transketolase subunit A [Coriobacterium glomerans PW2]